MKMQKIYLLQDCKNSKLFFKILREFFLEQLKSLINKRLSKYMTPWRENYCISHVLIRLIENRKKSLNKKSVVDIFYFTYRRHLTVSHTTVLWFQLQAVVFLLLSQASETKYIG